MSARRTFAVVGLALLCTIAACDRTNGPDLPAWPDDGITLPVGEYRFAMDWDAGPSFQAGSSTGRLRVLFSRTDSLSIRWISGPGAAETAMKTERVVRVDSAFYHLPAFPGTAAPFYVQIARPGGAERVDCSGVYPVPSSHGYTGYPLRCTLRLAGP